MKRTIDQKKLNTFILSQQKNKTRFSEYLHPYMAYPDKDSEFYQTMGKTKYLLRLPIIGKNLFLPKIIDKMIIYNYDAHILKYKDNFIGFTAYQIKTKDDSNLDRLNMFRVFIEPDFRGNNLGLYLIENLFNYCANIGIPEIKLGKGNDQAVNKLIDIINSKQYVFKKTYLGNNEFSLL